LYRRSFVRALRAVAAGALASPLLAACASAPATPTAPPPTPAASAPPTVQPSPSPSPVTATATQPPTATALPTVTPSPSVVATRSPSPTAPGMRSPSATSSIKVGDPAVQVFLWGNPQTDLQLRLAKGGGFGWIKQSFEWRYIEPHVKGTFDWGEPDRVVSAVNAAGLKLIARVDNQPVWARADKVFPVVGPPDKLSDFTDFLSAMAARYKGRIHAYEIWNEPNLAREWGNKPPDPKGYVQMVAASYKALKAIDPNALVITAGMAPTTASGAIAMPDVDFLKAMYQAGLKGNFDLLGVHAAGYKAPPEASPDEVAKNPQYNHNEGAAGRIYCFRHVEDLRAVMTANGDAERRVAVMEMGWTSDDRPNSLYRWHSVTEAEKADYLVRAFKFARANWSPWMGMMTIIYQCAPHWTKNDEQYYWCITNPDGTSRPAYDELKKYLGGS